jgi:hypothetical protein
MNRAQSEAKVVITKAVFECLVTWPITAREMEEVLISIAGDIAVDENGFITTGDDGFLKLSRPIE